jgi:thiol:disulfide interchange protein DsbD
MRAATVVRRAAGVAWAAHGLLYGHLAAQASGFDLVTRPHVTVQLVPEYEAVVPGLPMEVAVRFTLDEGWHLYWQNPGAGGIATTVEWRHPTGFHVGGLRFPVPELRDVSGIRTHILEGDVVLLATVTPSPATRLSPARLVAEVRYGICRDVCLPGNAKVTVQLPWGATPEPNRAWAQVRALAEARAPRTSGAPAASGVLKDSIVVIRVEGPDLSSPVTFFPAERAVAPAAVTVPGRSGRRVVTLSLPLAATPAGPLRGVLTVGTIGWDVSLPLKQ